MNRRRTSTCAIRWKRSPCFARWPASSRRAVLIVLHDLNLASRFADRVALMDRGRLVRCGVPAEVLTAETLSALFAFPLQVLPHPVRGFPLIIPDGEEAPQEGSAASTAAPDSKSTA